MKKKIAWITDSVSYVPQEIAEKNNIYTVPLSVIFGDEVFKDGVDITPTKFYQRLMNTDEKVTTSQPAVGEFVKLFEKLKEEYEMGIAIHLTSKVSGTYETSIMASEMAGFKMIHLDSKIGSKAQEYLILEGVRLEKEGKSVSEIVEHLNTMIQNVKGILLVGSLEQLHKGGRVSGVGKLLGNLLQIKPILEFQDGSLLPKEKVRTMKKAELRLIEIFKESYNNHQVQGVSIVHSETREKALKLKENIQAMDECLPIFIGELSPVLGAHLGAGTIGILWFETKC